MSPGLEAQMNLCSAAGVERLIPAFYSVDSFMQSIFGTAKRTENWDIIEIT